MLPKGHSARCLGNARTDTGDWRDTRNSHRRDTRSFLQSETVHPQSEDEGKGRRIVLDREQDRKQNANIHANNCSKTN